MYLCTQNLVFMPKITNPFFVRGAIPSAYFCDREQETEKLIRWLTNNNNVVLIASRRIGKTKLIDHCFEQPAIHEHYYTIFVDILQTSNLQEFTYELGRAVFDALSPVSRRMIDLFIQTVRSIHGEFGYDLTGLPKWSFSLGHIQNPVYTLEEIFSFVEHTDKPCIIAIDEFQRVAQYPETNVESILRTHIQRLGNCGFVFAGSERHLLNLMFQDKNRPFYDSARLLPLANIDRDRYLSFAEEHFHEFDKCIAARNVGHVYDLFSGNTFALQKTMNTAFSLTPIHSECTIEIIRKAIDEIIEENDYDYRTRLQLISPSQKETLYAIARQGIATHITGSDFISRYRLTSASSVQSAVRRLIADGWVVEEIENGEKSYQLSDLFLALWIQQRYGMGYRL